ncbi:hypothetical protein A3758_12690 [Oleiphilus sp. HI0118]|nr:hypothetical protein A3758_12690 [Oleiphilus sp. HI0118]
MDLSERIERNQADNRLLDRIAEDFCINSEADLAARLGIPQPSLHKIRKQDGVLSWKHRFIVLDKIGFLHARAGLKAITPAALFDRMSDLTNNEMTRIARDRLFDETKSPSQNILLFLEKFEDLKENEFFKEQLDISSERFERIRAGQDFKWEERAIIIQALSRTDREKWNFEVENLLPYLKDSSALVDKLNNLAYPYTEDEIHQNELIDNFKKVMAFETDVQVAKEIGLTKQQIAQARKGKPPLSIQARFRMAYALDRKSKCKDPINLEDVEALANSSDLIYKKLYGQEKDA